MDTEQNNNSIPLSSPHRVQTKKIFKISIIIITLVIVISICIYFFIQLQASPSISLDLFLDGIGKAGNITDASASSNINPTRLIRTVNISLYNQNDVMIALLTGVVEYDPESGSFKGNIPAKQVKATGPYELKISMDGYYRKSVSGMYYLKKGYVQIPQQRLIVGDLDNNGQYDVNDLNIIKNCIGVATGKNVFNCSFYQRLVSDVNDDGVVNSADVDLFRLENSVQLGE